MKEKSAKPMPNSQIDKIILAQLKNGKDMEWLKLNHPETFKRLNSKKITKEWREKISEAMKKAHKRGAFDNRKPRKKKRFYVSNKNPDIVIDMSL
jgi:hypothetical protein